MSMVGTKGTWIAALLLSAGLIGGSGLTAGAAPTTQASTAAQTTTNADQCVEDEGDHEDESGDQDDIQDENGADDAAEGDADTAEDEDGEDGDEDEDEDETAKPGELSEGQDLLPEARISVEQAVQAAQKDVAGTLGSVELEEEDGQLVFEVEIGDQEVFIDAGNGTIVDAASVEAGDEENDDDCGEDAAAQG